LAIRSQNFNRIEESLNSDMSEIAAYCKKWRLKPSVSKTVSSCFHLRHAQSSLPLKIFMNGQKLAHDPKPVYLGVTLDRTLTFKDHLTKTAQKVKSRNSLLGKLAGSTWGANAQTLHSSGLALCYSTGEYCAPVWLNSAHVKQVDTQLNQTMRTITGCMRPTNLAWLPVLANIPPPNIRREEALRKLLFRLKQMPQLPIHDDIWNPPTLRLTSRHPIWTQHYIQELSTAPSTADRWRSKWERASPKNSYLITNPEDRVPGFNLPRHLWTNINRFRCDTTRCADTDYKWGLRDNPHCCCGAVEDPAHILAGCAVREGLPGGLTKLHSADHEAIAWLRANC
jgi:hypothetical protein